MSKDFKRYKLIELTRIVAGGDLPDSFSIEQTDFLNVPVYSNGEKNNGLHGFTDIFKINEPAVTISARGSKVGFAAIRKQPFYPIVRLLSLIPHKDVLDVNFLFYNLKLNRQIGTGSGQPQITIPDISNRTISIPSLITQRHIASVLSALDDKIELNNRINAELEQMAKTLYDYWFVQFDFPNEAGKPYKASGGKMVYNEVLKREVPEGWEVKTLNYFLTEFTKGITTAYVDKSNLVNLNQKVNKGFNLDRQYFKYLDEKIEIPESKFARQKDILINSLGQGTLGRIHFFLGNVNNVVVDQHLFILRADTNVVYPSYLYQTLNSNAYQLQIERQITGSTGMQMLNAANLKDIQILLPNKFITRHFEELIFNFYEKVEIQEQQNQELSSLRDWLLPMLMNGQVTVGKAEEMIEEQLEMVAEDPVPYKKKGGKK